VTPHQRRLHKLGNAIRAFRGCKFASGKWFIPPQKKASERVSRWLFRCRWHKDISLGTESKIKTELAIV
jgi:hypothetical protein